MARRPKLTQEMVDEAIRLKAEGLSNDDIVCVLEIHESTFYRRIGDPKNRLQRELGEGLKKEESSFKRTLLTTIRSAALARNQYFEVCSPPSYLSAAWTTHFGVPRKGAGNPPWLQNRVPRCETGHPGQLQAT